MDFQVTQSATPLPKSVGSPQTARSTGEVFANTFSSDYAEKQSQFKNSPEAKTLLPLHAEHAVEFLHTAVAAYNKATDAPNKESLALYLKDLVDITSPLKNDSEVKEAYTAAKKIVDQQKTNATAQPVLKKISLSLEGLKAEMKHSIETLGASLRSLGKKIKKLFGECYPATPKPISQPKKEGQTCLPGFELLSSNRSAMKALTKDFEKNQQKDKLDYLEKSIDYLGSPTDLKELTRVFQGISEMAKKVTSKEDKEQLEILFKSVLQRAPQNSSDKVESACFEAKEQAQEALIARGLLKK